jgi:putative transposase
MVIDHWALNTMTIKDRFPLPHLKDLIAWLQRARCFFKLDFHSGYHQHCMHPDSIEMTAFIGPDGLYEWLLMPFGVANAPSEFMRLMTDLLRKHIDDGYYIVFLEDIMI